MRAPSANTRARRKVRSTASQPLIEKPASRWTRMRRSGNGFGDRADDEAEKLQREQRPGDRLQTVGVRGDERVARAHRLDDREQARQDGVVERNRGQTEPGDRAQAHDQPVCLGRRREVQSAHDPLLVREDEQQSEDHGAHQPVHDDEDPQQDVRERQRGG